jgi:hypothetical protein
MAEQQQSRTKKTKSKPDPQRLQTTKTTAQTYLTTKKGDSLVGE